MKNKSYIKRALWLFAMLCIIVSMLAACDRSDTVEFNKGDAKVIAHRGLSSLEMENTDAAFIAAGERSYYGIESDVRKTADGQFVMCHDADLSRIAGEEVDVEGSTLAELMEIALYDKEGKKDDDLRLATLESYIEIAKRYDKQAILELKSSFTVSEIGQIVDIISELEYLDRVTFISFDYDNLLYVREHLPSSAVQYLFSELSDETFERLKRDRIDAAMKFTYVSSSVIEKLHGVGLTVNCWTVDSQAVAERLCSMGVDYITTNILE